MDDNIVDYACVLVGVYKDGTRSNIGLYLTREEAKGSQDFWLKLNENWAKSDPDFDPEKDTLIGFEVEVLEFFMLGFDRRLELVPNPFPDEYEADEDTAILPPFGIARQCRRCNGPVTDRLETGGGEICRTCIKCWL